MYNRINTFAMPPVMQFVRTSLFKVVQNAVLETKKQQWIANASTLTSRRNGVDDGPGDSVNAHVCDSDGLAGPRLELAMMSSFADVELANKAIGTLRSIDAGTDCAAEIIDDLNEMDATKYAKSLDAFFGSQSCVIPIAISKKSCLKESILLSADDAQLIQKMLTEFFGGHAIDSVRCVSRQIKGQYSGVRVADSLYGRVGERHKQYSEISAYWATESDNCSGLQVDPHSPSSFRAGQIQRLFTIQVVIGNGKPTVITLAEVNWYRRINLPRDRQRFSLFPHELLTIHRHSVCGIFEDIFEAKCSASFIPLLRIACKNVMYKRHLKLPVITNGQRAADAIVTVLLVNPNTHKHILNNVSLIPSGDYFSLLDM